MDNELPVLKNDKCIKTSMNIINTEMLLSWGVNVGHIHHDRHGGVLYVSLNIPGASEASFPNPKVEGEMLEASPTVLRTYLPDWIYDRLADLMAAYPDSAYTAEDVPELRCSFRVLSNVTFWPYEKEG